MRWETGWAQKAKITASDGATGDNFGNSVAASGSTAVVGAERKNSEAQPGSQCGDLAVAAFHPGSGDPLGYGRCRARLPRYTGRAEAVHTWIPPDGIDPVRAYQQSIPADVRGRPCDAGLGPRRS